jgi:mannose-6-phosphate isomerase-like protein (cupin superfamily)
MSDASLPRTIAHRFTGEQVRFIETAEETKGKHLLIEVTLPAYGDGPPLHIHDEFEETFECVHGQLTLSIGKKKVMLYRGDQIRVEKHIRHTFNNERPEPVIFRVKLTPPSRFEASIRIHYGLMNDGLTNRKGHPKSLLHTALILSLQNTCISGIPVLWQKKLLGYLIRKGRRKEAYKALTKCTGSSFNP